MKLRKQSPWLLAGLSLACAAGWSSSAYAQRLPNGTNQVALADFDNATPTSDYGYWYSGPTSVDGGGYYRDRYYIDPLIDADKGPQVFQYTFDSTVFQGQPCTQPGGWWGTGFGMPVPWGNDPTVFNSYDPADYILSFDARVEGLVEGQTKGNCVMEFRLGTGGGSGWVMVKQLPYQCGSNWTHFVFHLDEGTWIGADQTPSTSFEMFTNAVGAGTINTIAFNQNQPNPDAFGFDADNAIYIDNVKLEVLQYSTPPPPAPPKVALAVFDYNFDDKDLWWAWPSSPETTTGWSANANTATYSAVRQAQGMNGSYGFAISMDNTAIATDPPGIPAWAGGNASAGGLVNYSVVTSSDLKEYRLNFDAMAVGLLDGQTTPFVVQLYFNAPDDTLSPADSDSNRDNLLRLNVPVNGVTNEWKHFIVSLKDGAVDAGSLANFQTYLSKIDEITFQLQIQNPHQIGVWGTDADNQIIVDNFKLERLVTGTSALKLTTSGNNVTVTWDPPSTGTTKLQSAVSLSGPWQDVTDAVSPYTTSMQSGANFFRTLWVAP